MISQILSTAIAPLTTATDPTVLTTPTLQETNLYLIEKIISLESDLKAFTQTSPRNDQSLSFSSVNNIPNFTILSDIDSTHPLHTLDRRVGELESHLMVKEQALADLRNQEADLRSQVAIKDSALMWVRNLLLNEERVPVEREELVRAIDKQNIRENVAFVRLSSESTWK